MSNDNGKRTEFLALACRKCGAPMYPDMKRGGMYCVYCGHFYLFAPTDEDYLPAVRFRHQPLTIVDDYIKLGHVAITNKNALIPPPAEERKMRTSRLDEKIRAYDAESFAAINDDAYFEITCPYCGKIITERFTENVFTCPYCGQKFGAADNFLTGNFNVKLIIGRKLNFFGVGLPFHINRARAVQNISALKRRFPNDFYDDAIDIRAQDELIAAYVPVQIADLRWKMQIRSEKGTFYFYQESINWAWTYTLMFDYYLLDELTPWDYGEISIMKPAYFEGNVRLFACQNIGDWKATIPNYILQKKTPARLKEALGIKKCEILSVSRDLRNHKYGLLSLPIYFLDCSSEVGEHDRQTRVMVNGQTGKTVALILEEGKDDIIRAWEPKTPFSFSAERTMLSPPLPVRYVKSPFLHERITLP